MKTKITAGESFLLGFITGVVLGLILLLITPLIVDKIDEVEKKGRFVENTWSPPQK